MNDGMVTHQPPGLGVQRVLTTDPPPGPVRPLPGSCCGFASGADHSPKSPVGMTLGEMGAESGSSWGITVQGGSVGHRTSTGTGGVRLDLSLLLSQSRGKQDSGQAQVSLGWKACDTP